MPLLRGRLLMLPFSSAAVASGPLSAAVVVVSSAAAWVVGVWSSAAASVVVVSSSAGAVDSVDWLSSTLEAVPPESSGACWVAGGSGAPCAAAAGPRPAARGGGISPASTPATPGARRPERRGGRNEDTMAPSLSGVVEVRGCRGGCRRRLSDRQPALHLLLVVFAVEPVATRFGCREADQGARLGGQVPGDLEVTEGEVVLGGVGVGHVQHDLGPGCGLVDGRGPGGVAALQRLLGPAVQLDRSGLGGLAGVLVRGTVSSAVLCGRNGAAGGGQRHRDQGRNGQEQTASRHRGPSLVREFPLPPGNSRLGHRIPNISQEFWTGTGTRVRARPNSDSSSRRSRSLARNSRE